MCRYAEYGPYKDHYACFTCRKMFRQWTPYELARPLLPGQTRSIVCPQCAQPMHDLGKDFKAPKQRDVEQWRKVELLFRHGCTFHSCGCNGPGPRPARLRDVQPFLAERKRLEHEFRRERRLATEEEERSRRRKQATRTRHGKRLARAARRTA